MPILSDIYSAGNTLKRRIGGLLDDPNGSLEQFVGQLRDDMNRNSDLMNQAGWGQIDRVKYTPEQRAAAQKKLADIGTNMAMSAATVWHGSPHKFDKFDASKIGTGEGAQAYGHGLYLAENPAVATEYSKMASGAGGQIPSQLRFVNGQEVQPGTGAYKAASLLDNMSVSQARKTVNGWLQGARPEEQAYFKEVADTLGGITSKAAVKQKAPGGSLYKVDLPDEHIAKMLDWDKPLSQQAPEVQAALANTKNKHLRAVVDYASSPYSTPGLEGEVKTMGEAIKLLGMNQSPAKGSQMLAKQGIPGIRYLDGGSRGAGQGSSNFVVFPGNEGILKILERNGQPLGLLGD